jgi:phospholipid-binding lipoprotein MlaA
MSMFLLLVVALAGCAMTAESPKPGSDDPLEASNRAVFNMNSAIDDGLIKPLAEAYRAALPQWLRDRIRAFIDNLAEPRIWVNDILQGRINDSGITFGRFVINTTMGLGGLFDVAGEHGLPRQTGDFGETLAVWGFDSGPYLVLPLFGPSNVRDAFGLGVDLYTTPPAHLIDYPTGIYVNVGLYTLSGFDLRSRNIDTLDQIKSGALDYYAQLRSITRQYREGQIRAARGLADAPEELIDPGAPSN